MASKYPRLYNYIYLFTILGSLVSMSIYNVVVEVELIISILLVLLLGIPHGATDHILFQHIDENFLGAKNLIQFYLLYLGLGMLYLLVWWFFPILALVLFLVISMYHFGQSNWQYLDNRMQPKGKSLLYFIWGGFAILSPILFHFNELIDIISNIIRRDLVEVQGYWLKRLVFIMMGSNVLVLIYLFWDGILTKRAFQNEAVALLLLSILYIVSPPLLGFAIYFVFWHSMPSIMDQVAFLKTKRADYSIQNYIIDTIPITIIVLISIVAFYLLLAKDTLQIEVGWMFVFISIVTLPHVLLIELLYKEKIDS